MHSWAEDWRHLLWDPCRSVVLDIKHSKLTSNFHCEEMGCLELEEVGVYLESWENKRCTVLATTSGLVCADIRFVFCSGG